MTEWPPKDSVMGLPRVRKIHVAYGKACWEGRVQQSTVIRWKVRLVVISPGIPDRAPEESRIEGNLRDANHWHQRNK